MRIARLIIMTAALVALGVPQLAQAAPKAGRGKPTADTSTLDIATTLSESSDPVIVGTELTYRAVVSNVGSLVANDLQAAVPVYYGSDRATAVIRRVSSSQGQCAIAASPPFGGLPVGLTELGTRSSVPVCRIGTLAPGESATIEVVVHPAYPTYGDIYWKRLEARSYHSLENVDSNWGNNRDHEDTAVTTGSAAVDCALNTPHC